MKRRGLSRRNLLQAGAASIVLGAPGLSRTGKSAESPNERLNIASVGTTNRARANLRGVEGQNIVALCDVDAGFLERAGADFPQARRYRDFRQMLENEAERIDAVIVSTPDHAHAPAAAMALRMGKHVYCEKPLTHTVFEARVLARLAKGHKLATQMGTQIHAGENYRRVVELIQSGAIGKVREAHVWVDADYSSIRFTDSEARPPHLDWDLWLGPAAKRPYTEGLHPFLWRQYWDFGTGQLGDFGCHYIDLVQWALKLGQPTFCKASGPPVEQERTSAGLVVQWEFPARDELPAVRLTWHDGGKRPAILSSLRRKDGSPLEWGSGQLFVGEEGVLISDYNNHLLLPEEKFAGFSPPAPFIPRSIGHHQEWIEACKTGKETTCNFDYAGRLTETVLLGTVAYRSGQPLKWDAENLRAVGAPESEEFVHREYRKGWTL